MFAEKKASTIGLPTSEARASAREGAVSAEGGGKRDEMKEGGGASPREALSCEERGSANG